ncbi:MAG: hypothetical protein QM597_01715 [Aeromicrobium sp.]|uniref:hypothetical protein n=1 Tax=Aeromicrobium sp. TaxID=1871063 RepID=UPI0039E457F7
MNTYDFTIHLDRSLTDDDYDLLPLKAIAERVGRTYESVRLLSLGKRGPGGFPAPMSGEGWSLYSWTVVADWFTKHFGDDLATGEHARIAAAADHLLRARALMPALSDLGALAS